jgi:hypothetical protein
MVVSRADRKNNELQVYGLTRFSISLLLCQGARNLRNLPDDEGVLGGLRKVPNPLRWRGAGFAALQLPRRSSSTAAGILFFSHIVILA